MKDIQRLFLFPAFIAVLLVCLTAGLAPAQDEDEEQIETYTNLQMPLRYQIPSITPFPQARDRGGIYFHGDPQGLLALRRVSISKKTSWDLETRNILYERRIKDHKLETPRFQNYLVNARVYSEEGVNRWWIENMYESTKRAEKDKAAGLVNIKVDLPAIGSLVEAVAGEGSAGLNVTGYQKISFSGRSQWTDTESDAINRVNKFPSLDMEQVSRYKITGTIGTKITVEVDQNSERKTDLANTIKIRYKGTEDEIIQSIEAGNTNLSLPNTQFVGYSQRVQGLFGIKSTAKIGPLDLTAIVSQEKGSTETSSFTAGASQQTNYKRDYNYLERTFFWLGLDAESRGKPTKPRVAEIIESEIFVYQQSNVNNDINSEQWEYARVSVDPAEPFNSEANDEDIVTTVRRLEYDEYYVYNRSKYLEVFTYDRRKLIAGWFRVQYDNGEIAEIGSKVGDTLDLKLIALEENRADSTMESFYYEWRNVYSLGARDIDPNGIEVKIFYGPPGTETQEDNNLDHTEDGTPYIQILGLDRTDVTGSPTPDGRIDANNPNILIRDRGYLIFPHPEPFNMDTTFATNTNARLPEKVPEIYNLRKSSITSRGSEFTEYYIQFATSQRQTEYYLGHINIIEGSERVVLNGEELQRNRDYRIYYELGRINFLTDKVSDPNADLQIDFEYEPFIASEKKSLFGIRGEYELSQNFNIGGTLLYKGEKSTDRKPRVGQETSKYMVWDTDFSYKTELPFLTKLTDALPFIEAKGASPLQISGELAQSRPNPNVAGEAYVDDFESSKEAYSLGVIRYQWDKSSAPPDTIGPRGKLYWYNRYDPYSVQQIYNRDVRGSDHKTTLALEFRPANTRKIEVDSCQFDEEPIDPSTSWAGIMRGFSSSAMDQTRAQLLEIRMRTNYGNSPLNGKLVIDLGEISEDIDGDGFLDSEDTNQNGILESFEDVGLDQLADSTEPCYDPTDNPDPNDDNYSYEDKDDYSNINGTENNRFDAGGNYPDTEDISGEGQLDISNNYFQFTIDYADLDRFRVAGSNINGWETFQIPLKDSSNYDFYGNPDWGRIAYARMWVTDFDTTTIVEIADINIVTVRWEEDSAIYPTDIDRTGENTSFTISVINTEDNTNYESPPGVEGYYDKTTDTYEKEQSLLVRFNNLNYHEVIEEVVDSSGNPTDSTIVRMVPDTAIASRTLFQAEDYAGYQKIRMFVHGPDSLPGGEASPIRVLFRLGRDRNNFYGYHTNIYPGWHDSNHVVIDFNEITPLKDDLTEARLDDPSINEITVGKYTVRGSPSLTTIQYFAIGITNSDTLDYMPISGELWLDELRLSDARDDNGMAMRASISGGFSDFISYSANYKNQDEYFRNLTAANKGNLGSGKQQTSYSYTTRISLHKFLPPSWGASLPFSYSWSRNESTPRLKPGSDIIIPDDDLEAQTSRSTNRRFSISQSFRKRGGNLLFNLILNRIKTSFSYNETQSKSPTVPTSQSESYTAKGSYDLSPKGKFTIPILFWLRPIPLLPDAIGNSELSYLPSTFKMSAVVQKTYSSSINNQDFKTSTYNRTLDGDLAVKWPVFKSMQADYSLQTKRDIRDTDDIKFSFKPSEMKLGIELDNKQNFNLNYSPALFNFLTHKFSYRADYHENSDPARNQAGTRNVRNGNSITVSGSFRPKAFFGTGHGGSAPPPDSDSTKKGGGFAPHKPILAFVRFFTNRLGDISGSYSIDNKYTYWGLEERPTWRYILGLSDDPGVEINDSVISRTARNVNTQTVAYNARSDVRFIMGSRINAKYAFNESESSVRKNRSEGTTFPDLSWSLSNLERYKLISFFFNSLAIDTRYAKKEDLTFSTADTTIGEVLQTRTISENYAPFFGMNFTWFNKLQCNLKYDRQISERENYNAGEIANETRTTSNNWQFSMRFTLNARDGSIKLPIFGRLKSSLSFNISISRKHQKSENNSHNDKGWTTTSDKTDFTIMPRISYSFSTNINGGLSARWQDSNDKTRFQKSHVRELGIWVEINF